MTKQRQTVMIRVDTRTNAALNMLVAEMKARRGRKVTQTQVIWQLLEQHAPEIVARVEQLMPDEADEDDDES
jgi:hypothetical protein